MEVIILNNSVEVGETAASLIASTIHRNPRAVLGLATGSSPSETYLALARMVEAGTLNLSKVAGFALDEYVGIPADHPASYAAVIQQEVVIPLGMTASQVQVPNGRAQNLAKAAAEYERQIVAAGGVDVQILGIGRNGHIGFNEPTSSFASRTRVKTLSEETRRDNARFFDRPDDVPMHCLTQGLGTILDAGRLILVATGASKAAATAAAVEGAVSSFVPASALQLHAHATVIVDEAAASLLALSDYYRYTYANKPS